MSEKMLELHLDSFDGPLALLLHLIRQSKMDIYDINITAITEQYIAYLQQLKHVHIQIAGEFLVMAANLMRIKSKVLLAEELAIDEPEDPRQPLVDQLLEYKKYQEAAKQLRKKAAKQQLWHSITPGAVQKQTTIQPNDLSVELLRQAWQRLQSRRQLNQQPISNEQIQEWKFEIPTQIKILENALDEHPAGLFFSQLLNPMMSKEELVTDFLALLTMVRSQLVEVTQQNYHADIWIRRRVHELVSTN
ncbi:Segregation and condensation protein A [Fructilactobacillus florum 8D]|uniref:Segregation and condensation protein A n=1 Tax=Fructilactobacillus florum 8D TaxID=1221538 RepID=W9EFK5_9LACO|nr:segregation/condensation protein A [Fructilactobacillus florum]EKK20177.1 Segregation and condensation protein A [Fructilactobacillus florum 2F]ETO40862.1 Segregation and condensation protein A [Fructilactobacillus florum 8D]